jgi:hypothetical protein
MFNKTIRAIGVLMVIASLAGNAGVVRAEGSASSSLSVQNPKNAPQSQPLPSLTIPPASSLGVQFVHIATAENIASTYTTIIDHPRTNGNPNAIIIVTPDDNPGDTGGVNDTHPIGVMYNLGKWVIFNQDLAAMPVGAAFNVIIPTAGAGVFVQNTNVLDISEPINSPLTDNNPNANILVTPNYNPGGACPCVSANFNFGLFYSVGKWRIYTQDLSLITNVAFNVFVLPAGAGVFVQTATVGNTTNVYSTYIDNALTNNNPNAIIFLTHNYSPGGSLNGSNNNHPTGVFYNGSKWEIYNRDLVAMPVDASFNVLVLVPSSAIFIHTTTTGSGGGVNPYTLIDKAMTNDHASAVLFATQNLTPGGVSGENDNHNIGVFYDGYQWGVLNQDVATMAVGAAFNVFIPNPDASVFVQKATAANILSHSTVIDYPLTNGKPNATLFVTPNYNQGGGGGVYEDHPIGVFYDGSNWRVFNQDGAAMPVDAAFNVFVPAAGAGVFVHTATVGNILNPDATQIDNALTNGKPNAMIIVTPNWNPGGVGGTNDSHPIGVYYDGTHWEIFNQDGGAMPTDAAFNVYVVSPTTSFRSVAASDGWILESTETSNVGGTLDNTATTFNLGDDAGNKQYRAILSFNTKSLPDNAVITRVTLQIRTQGLVGTNPFTTHGGLVVDIRKPFFGTTVGMSINDFQAAASKSAVGKFGITPVSNWYSASLGSAGYPYVNLTGTTQFRLRFVKDDNNDNGADYIKFFSGNYTTAGIRPTLIIEYYLQ